MREKESFWHVRISGEKPFKGGRRRGHYVFIIIIYKNQCNKH